MQEQKRVDSQSEEDSHSDQESESQDRVFNSDPVEDERDTTWSGLARRYKRTWKARLNEDQTTKGIRNFSLIVSSAAILGGAASYPSASAAIATAPVSMVLAMAGASIVVGYNNDLDDFVNAHLGAGVGTMISAYLIATSILSAGSATMIAGSAFAGLWYISSLTVAAVGYGLMGRWLNPDSDEGK